MATKKEKGKQKKSKTSRAKKAAPKAKQAPKAAVSEKGARPNHIVGMGASAGGLDAFEQFFNNMKPTSGMAFILVPHLDPTHISIMPELIQKRTKMRVFQAKDGMAVEPDTLYIIPPNSDMALLKGTLQLIEPLAETGPRMSIDYFFRSLAQDQREKAICVILSGMGTDGSLGLKAIKEELGMAMVQDVDSAKYDGMPRSAIETELVDYVLPPREMPEQLIRYAKHVNQKPPGEITPAAKELPDSLQKIFVLLRSATGHDFSLYKQNTISRRVERRMNVLHIETVSNYVRYLRQDPHEARNLFKELLIGVTNFFRDAEAFEVLKNEALPKMLANKPEDAPVRVWVPGCSTGEEAYSVAIALRECMDGLKRYADVQIFATDIDEDAIEKARAGVYPDSIAVDVNNDRLKRYFIKENGIYRINKDIRDVLVFAPQNIIKDPPFTKLDLICCRNLLIYLDTELQKKLLPLFYYSLNPGGILFLGSSETIGGFGDLFSVMDKKWRVFRRKETADAAHIAAQFPLTTPPAILIDREVTVAKTLSIPQMAEKSLLEKYAPPCAIIKATGEIVYIHGRTGKYLEPAPGEARLNIFEMAREGLKLEIPSATRRAITHNREITYEGLQVKVNGEVHRVNVTAKPMGDSEAMRGLLMVMFEDVKLPEKKKPRKRKTKTPEEPQTRVIELEREIQYLKESHQIAIEEAETAQEELNSTNEELQSTNEELQSTNEEMETSKEELQSLNEELLTLNAELEGKNEELTSTNNDMKNLLDSVDVPTIFVDNDLCIKRFTKHATKIVRLIPTDVGRPIKDIVLNLEYDDLVGDIEEVLKTLAFKEADHKTKDGQWFFVRIMPYRTMDNVIDGAVITFEDITERKQSQHALEDSQSLSDGIFNTVREPLLVLDSEFRVLSANDSFYKTFKVTSQETEGRQVAALGEKQWDISKLQKFLKEIIPMKKTFEDFEVEHDFPHIGRRKVVLNGREIHAEGMGTKKILLSIQDITGED